MTLAVFEPIGHIDSRHCDIESTPPQATQADGIAAVVVNETLVEGLLGLDRYDHLWLVTWLDRQPGHRPLRLVPRATEATGEIQGVFASRSPVRPNAIGVSLVRQLGIAGNVITIAAVDLVHGTPVLDIKPWFADCDLPV